MNSVPISNFTLVTSHHPYLSADEYLRFHRISAPVVSIPEFITTYRPARSYYVPHDLIYPYKDEEIPALKYFDGLLMPNERFWYLNRFAPVLPLGWLKLRPEAEQSAPSHQVALIPSEIPRLLRLAPDRLAQLLVPILERKPLVLLPNFGEIERIAGLARRCGAHIAPWGTSTQSVISDAQFVVSCGISSVIAEATAHRRPVVCLADGSFTPDEQRKHLGELPGVFFGDAEKGLSWIDELAASPAQYEASRPQTDILPFDTTRFLELLAAS